MGTGMSTNAISDDGVWGSVATLSDSVSNKSVKDCWGEITPKTFEGFNDQDMVKISSIFVSKHVGDIKSGGWVVDHSVIRIIDVEWNPEYKGYETTTSIKVDYVVSEKKYSVRRMYRLAFHLEALEDYRELKLGKSDGSTFYKISKELVPYHKRIT